MTELERLELVLRRIQASYANSYAACAPGEVFTVNPIDLLGEIIKELTHINNDHRSFEEEELKELRFPD